METLILYLLLGALAGTLAGLLGVGGGLVIVPVLTFVFRSQGFAEAFIVHLAVGTSLATIVFTSISSVRAHHKRGAVLWPVVRQLTPGIIAGSLLGAAIADAMPAAALRIVFGVFELAVATEMAFGRKPSPHRQLPALPGMFATGSVIGSVSAIIGIGGGTLTVPFLTWCNVAMRNAVATSAACGLPIAVAGTAGFVVTGWNEPGLPEWSTGYVYWPALLVIALATVVFAPLGARLAHALPATALKKFFAVFLAFLGVRMLIG